MQMQDDMSDDEHSPRCAPTPIATQAQAQTLAVARAFADANYLAELDCERVLFRVAERAPQLESRLPASAYGFVTAWNPGAVRCTAASNIAADAGLVSQLERIGADHHRAWAQDPFGMHREPGWLVTGLMPSQVDALGRAFGQAGVLAWGPGEPVRLRMLMPGPTSSTARDPPCIDWIE